MKRNIGLVADNPTVMWDRWNVEEIASAQWNDLSVIKCGRRLASKNEADMFDRTPRQSNARPDTSRPFLARLISSSTDRKTT
jgi:hypothetical protein